MGGDRTWKAPIRILIADMPGLLGSVVSRTLSEERDMEVVAHAHTSVELREALGQPIDVIVTTPVADGPSAPVRALLFGPDPVPVVAVSADGRRVDVYGHSTIHGTGIEGLTALVREAVRMTGPRNGGR